MTLTAPRSANKSCTCYLHERSIICYQMISRQAVIRKGDTASRYTSTILNDIAIDGTRAFKSSILQNWERMMKAKARKSGWSLEDGWGADVQ
jgi:hypothetical protein